MNPLISRISRVYGLTLLLTSQCFACSSEGSVGSQPSLPNVTGEYSVSAVYGENGCAFTDWPTGNALQNVPFTVTQTGAELTAELGGIVGGVVALIHGSNKYTGTLKGNSATLTIFGTVPQSKGNCTYTFNNVVVATFSGDFVTGRLSFTPAVTGNPDCAAVACESVMSVNGARPPRQ